ncbi:MAG: hypothetical protein ABI586_08380 [Candidatus Nanopelagicales bacterium]
MKSVLRRVSTAVVAGAVAKAALVYLSGHGSRYAELLQRENHRGQPVTLAEGPSVVLGTMAGVVIAPGLPHRVRLAALLAVGASGAAGGFDDLYGEASTKGLSGHLGSLARGEVTSGAVKVAGIGATGLVSGILSRRGRGGVIDAVLAGTVIAGSANLLNLFDLRPGRAIKVFLAASTPVVFARGHAGDLLSAPVGATAALRGDDLAERSMLGDTGANALGAILGTAAASSMGRRGLLATSALVIGLTVASERVSFSQVIEQNRALAAWDNLGRHQQTT